MAFSVSVTLVPESMPNAPISLLRNAHPGASTAARIESWNGATACSPSNTSVAKRDFRRSEAILGAATGPFELKAGGGV